MNIYLRIICANFNLFSHEGNCPIGVLKRMISLYPKVIADWSQQKMLKKANRVKMDFVGALRLIFDRMCI